MSSILAAQRRSQASDMVALVATSRIHPFWLVSLGALVALILMMAALWWWSTDHSEAKLSEPLKTSLSAPQSPGSESLGAAAVLKVPVKVASLEPRLAFELRPLPDFNHLQQVDLLALRQQQYEALLAESGERVVAGGEAPEVSSNRQAALAQAPSVTAKPDTPTAQDKTELSLEQRFAQAVQATESLNWQQSDSTEVYDKAPMLGALSPDLQALLPSITFNSHVYSSEPARRHVTLNGQQLFEGDLLTERVELVAIRLNDIVLRVAGHLCRLNALADWGE